MQVLGHLFYKLLEHLQFKYPQMLWNQSPEGQLYMHVWSYGQLSKVGLATFHSLPFPLIQPPKNRLLLLQETTVTGFSSGFSLPDWEADPAVLRTLNFIPTLCKPVSRWHSSFFLSLSQLFYNGSVILPPSGKVGKLIACKPVTENFSLRLCKSVFLLNTLLRYQFF